VAIEYTLCCDECGHLIDAGRVSPTDTRRQARAEGRAIRVKGRDLCTGCSTNDEPTPDPKSNIVISFPPGTEE
jgi:hypothetical protein